MSQDQNFYFCGRNAGPCEVKSLVSERELGVFQYKSNTDKLYLQQSSVDLKPNVVNNALSKTLHCLDLEDYKGETSNRY